MTTKPTLSTQADLSASQTAGSPSLLMPTGVVLPFAGTSAPSGWLACDGSPVSRTTYAALFSAIGTSYGVGNGTTTFNLPDFRGYFPRFNDAMFGGSAAGRDSGRVHGSAQGQATAKNGLTVTNNAVDTGNQSADHTHSGSTNASTVPSNNVSGADNATALSGSANSGINPQNNSGSHSHSFTTGGVSANHTHNVTSNVVLNVGDTETRPINLSINAIIKI